MKTLLRDVRRQRVTDAAQSLIPDNGDTLLDVPRCFSVTSTGEEFSKYESEMAEIILIFGTEDV